MSDVIQGDLADERPVAERVLPMSMTMLLEHQVVKLLSSCTPEKLPAMIVMWLAPMIADRDHAIKKLRWLHAEQAWRLDDYRTRVAADEARLDRYRARMAELREQVAATGRGMSRLLDELAEARQIAGLDGDGLPEPAERVPADSEDDELCPEHGRHPHGDHLIGRPESCSDCPQCTGGVS